MHLYMAGNEFAHLCLVRSDNIKLNVLEHFQISEFIFSSISIGTTMDTCVKTVFLILHRMMHLVLLTSIVILHFLHVIHAV